MFGVLTNKGQVNYVSLDDFISIDKMNYFETYFEKQFDKFCNDLPRIVERNGWAANEYSKDAINDSDRVYLFNSLMSTWYDDIIPRDYAWKLVKTYVPEFVEYLYDNVLDYMHGFFIKRELHKPMEFHRDWGDNGLDPTEEDSRGMQETWIWFRFSDTKKLYVSDIDGEHDVSKRIPMESYGAVFNGLDYHGCYDGSSGFSVRINGGLKQNIIDDTGIDVTTWKEWYPATGHWLDEKLTL
jgi:hypothetical protein